jgi:hypothetical protein
MILEDIPEAFEALPSALRQSVSGEGFWKVNTQPLCACTTRTDCLRADLADDFLECYHPVQALV